MEPFNKADFRKLAEESGQTCISVYIPTHRGGQEVLQDKDKLKFKTQIQAIENQLKEKGKSADAIKKLLAPAYKLIDDDEFWRHQSDGLAVFIAEDFFQYYTLNIAFGTFNVINKRFYLVPLLPLLNNNHPFYILNMSGKNIQFFEADTYNISEINLEDFGVEKLSEVIKPESPENQLQQHSGYGNSQSALTHGHGEGKDVKHRLLKNYLTKLDNVLVDIMNSNKAPLVLAGVDDLRGHFREVSKYPMIYPEPISGNHDRTSTAELHKLALQLLKDHFEKEQVEQKNKFQNLAGTGKAETEIHSIVKNSVSGLIDQLFVTNSQPVWGHYDSQNHEVEIGDSPANSHEDLLNFAAVQTVLKGGNAYLLEKNEMPAENTSAAAIYRNG